MRARTLTLKERPDRSSQPLVDDAELERLRLITLQHRSRRGAPFAPGPGHHPTRLRGQGMDLHDVRPYQAGDDIRHIDWRATARGGKPVTKIFVAERARSLFLVIDRRPPMMFGTRRELKAATGVRTAAMLAFLALAEGETVAGIVLAESPRFFPPATTLEGVLPLLQTAAAPAPRPADNRTPMPAQKGPSIAGLVEQHADRGAALYLISDFYDLLQDDTALADFLPATRRSGTVAIRIVDQAEQEIKEAGVLRLVSPHGGAPVVVDTGDAEIRKHYQAYMAQRSAGLRAQCERYNVSLFTVTNYDDLLAQLEPLL